MKNLEEQVGVKFLIRTNQGVKLTVAGETLLSHARHVLRQLELLTGDLREFSTGLKGHVRVLANTTGTTEFLPAVLRTFLINHPNVTVDLHERLSSDVVRGVQDGAADIGVIAGAVRTDPLEVIPYRRERLVLATALSHPLAREMKVDFKEALGYEFIGLPEASAIHSFLKREAADLQRSLQLRIQVSNFEAACRMIEANVGVGVMPERTAARHAKTMALSIVPLNDDWAERHLQICVADRHALPMFARKLLDLLVEDGTGRQD
jgi:DNA-binding transcriptional LysR family regulator